MESSLLSKCSYDLLFEILSRCSLKVIDKSKVISKFFNEITYEHAFMQCHTKRTGTIYGYIFGSVFDDTQYYNFVSRDDDDDDISIRSTLTFDLLPPNSKIYASSDQGLLCYATSQPPIAINVRAGVPDIFHGRPHKFYVCKPATRQTEMLPDPNYLSCLLKMDLVVLQSNPLRYKIVGLCRDYDNRYACEIFDSKIWSWKLLVLQLPSPLSKPDNSVYASGRIHWLLSNDQGLVLDLVTETYTFFTLPVLEEENYSGAIHRQLVKYKGKLGLICEDLESFEIWAMEDHKNQVWKKIKKVSTESLKNKHRSCVIHALDLCSSNIALIKGRHYMFYNIENHSSDNVARLLPVTQPPEIFPFRSDLEPVDLRGRD